LRLVCLCLLVLNQIFASELQDANACPQYPTCEECIAHNPCGWCSVPVVYDDGTTGPLCAGKPKDPNNPPPGYKPWTCPKDFQNDKCYGYICNDQFQCVSSGAPGRGIPLADCQRKCFPPTYDCNTTTKQCYQVEPGHGTSLPVCEGMCNNTQTTGTTGSTTGDTTTGQSTSGGNPSPAPPGYSCDTGSLTCIQVDSGGVPKADCDAVCGKPGNNTPIFALGDYRGLQISKGYIKGEWQARIGQDSAIIVDPSRNVWAKGQAKAFNNELWMVSDKGINRGIYGINDLPEVEILTWAFGGIGLPPPPSFDAAMSSGTVFVFAKCLNPNNCKFNILQKVAEHLRNKFKDLIVEDDLKRDAEQIVRDPCMKYPDCHSCISAEEQCGWCSVNVLYFNGTVEGKNCAGLNTTVGPTINCTGSFSTQDCSFVTTTSASSTGQSTGGPATNNYVCDPTNYTCSQSSAGGGTSKDTCESQCNNIPVVPPVLQNQLFRGLQIDTHYTQGEWRAQFSTTDVILTDPSGKQSKGKVSQVERYLTITLPDGTAIQTLWQVSQGPSSQFLSWAWGAPGGAAPASFDSAMTTSGNTEYFFVSCLQGKDTTVCDFSQ